MSNDPTARPVRVRMAPSPTGFLHIGGLRTGLYNFLFARKNTGQFLLRIEDTDRSRYVEGAVENIVRTFTDFGLSPDEGPFWDDGIKIRGDKGPYFQSERLEIYQKYAQELLDKRIAYYCFCTPERLENLRKEQEAAHLPPKYDKHCLHLSEQEIRNNLDNKTPHVLRLNVPSGEKIAFNDLVHGRIEFSTDEIDDQVLMKSDGYPTYHLANVIDDHLMEISHVIRGEEWIPSTPKHILMYNAFGWQVPEFAHLPHLLGKNKKKLSKREGDVSVKDFIAKGYLPEALLNFVALLGWNPKTDQEVFSLDELIAQFSFDKVNRSGAIFDIEKLNWLNAKYLRALSVDEFISRVRPFLDSPISDDRLVKLVTLEQGRVQTLRQFAENIGFITTIPDYDPTLLIWRKSDQKTTAQVLGELQQLLQGIPSAKLGDKEAMQTALEPIVARYDRGTVYWPLRVALSGQQASPDPLELLSVLRQEEIEQRLAIAFSKINL